MSEYTDYSRTAPSYDQTRAAVGSEIWLGRLLFHFGELNGLRVLDAGCGTGNYTIELARHGCHLTAMDFNEGMLEQAKAKVESAGLGGRVTFRTGKLPDLPFADRCFDAVMFNQVLHHLEKPGETDFTGCRNVLRATARALDDGGLVLINACSRRQIEKSFWFYSLIAEAHRAALGRTVGSQVLENGLTSAGFGAITRTVPLDAVLQGDAYFDPRGPLDPNWRTGDSIWALAARDELAGAQNKVRSMDREGSLDAYWRTHDRDRPETGQTTFWSAVNMARDG